jgi:tetratricopeptide (TPR) repeat protein
MKFRLPHLCATLVLPVIMLSASSVDAEEPADLVQVLTEAQAAYDRGLVLEPVDQAAAQAAFSESADGWSRAIESGISNGQLWMNLGNAELHAGRPGEAIADYLEADRLMPGNARVRSNLLEARNQIPARFDADGVTVLYDTVSDGWHVIGFDVRWWMTAVAWVGFWALLAFRIARPRQTDREEKGEGTRLAFRATLVGLGAIAVVAGTTIGLDVAEDQWRTSGVLLQETVIRGGNGETFAEIFSEPLPAGVEFDHLETRPGWHHIEFADGRTGWVRSDHARLIGS